MAYGLRQAALSRLKYNRQYARTRSDKCKPSADTDQNYDDDSDTVMLQWSAWIIGCAMHGVAFVI